MFFDFFCNGPLRPHFAPHAPPAPLRPAPPRLGSVAPRSRAAGAGWIGKKKKKDLAQVTWGSRNLELWTCEKEI